MIAEQTDNISLGVLERFWIETLANRPLAVELPLDRQRRAVAEERSSCSLCLPDRLVDGLQRLAQRSETTLEVVLLSAFATLLHRYSAQDDLIICDAQGLPLRIRFSDDPGFREVLSTTRDVSIAALAHRNVPHEVLDRACGGSANALRQIGFSGLLPSETPGNREVDVTSSDVFLIVAGDDARLELRFDYRADLFEAATVEQMLLHMHTLADSIVEDPESRVSTLRMVGEEERNTLIAAWNRTESSYPNEATLAELIGIRAAERPDACSIIANDGSLSYAELATRASNFAERLRALGVGPGALVGVCLERSTSMLVALLGILKAGGAYVPLDPAFPPARLADVLDDCRAPLLVTQESVADVASGIVRDVGARGDYAPRVWRIDDDVDDTPVDSPTSPAREAVSSDLAYVLYTSGSTGRPKGVPVTHRALVNLLTSMIREPGLTGDDTLLAVTTLSFDIAGLELWLPLLVGGRVVVAPREAASDGYQLVELLESSRATVMQATPATWRLLLAAGWTGDDRLRILCGGEALPPDLAADLLARCRELWNMYGPTETTIWSALDCVRPGEPISLGHPIANTQLYVLEPTGDVTPFNVAGELCIGGDGVAAGYLNRSELTLERFIPDPFARDAEGRVYRTGDVVRRHVDGRLEYLGRRDNQIKLRGYRIELGDIEAALASCAGVRNVAAAVEQERTPEPQIVAYVVPEERADIEALHKSLQARLPAYMLPSTIVSLSELPLTPNGKLDRARLPVPFDSSRPAWRAPKSSVELTLAQLWQDLMGVDEPGADDDFFALGGTSLLATQLTRRIAEVCGFRIPVATIFSNPTLGALARVVANADERAFPSPVVEVQRAPTGESLFMVYGGFAGGRSWRDLARGLGTDYGVYGLITETPTNGKFRTVEKTAAALLAAVRRVQPKGPYRFCGYCHGGFVAFEMARQARLAGDVVADAILIAVPPLRKFQLPESLFGLGAKLGIIPCALARQTVLRMQYIRLLCANGFAPLLSRLFTSEARRTRLASALTGNARGGGDDNPRGVFHEIYRPRPYEGTLTVLLPASEEDDADIEVWRHSAADISFYRIGGNHLTSVREHSDAIGALLRSLFRRREAIRSELYTKPAEYSDEKRPRAPVAQ